MKSKSVEAKVLDARAKVAALRGDERADYPSGPERTAYNKELKNAVKLLAKWEAAFAAPEYTNDGLRPPPSRWHPTTAVSVGGASYDPTATMPVYPRRKEAVRPRPYTKRMEAKLAQRALTRKQAQQVLQDRATRLLESLPPIPETCPFHVRDGVEGARAQLKWISEGNMELAGQSASRIGRLYELAQVPE